MDQFSDWAQVLEGVTQGAHLAPFAGCDANLIRLRATSVLEGGMPEDRPIDLLRRGTYERLLGARSGGGNRGKTPGGRRDQAG